MCRKYRVNVLSPAGPTIRWCGQELLLRIDCGSSTAVQRTTGIVKGFRMPASHCARGCTEAGVRKASKEETAGGVCACAPSSKPSGKSPGLLLVATPPLTHFVTRVMLIRHWPCRRKSALLRYQA